MFLRIPTPIDLPKEKLDPLFLRVETQSPKTTKLALRCKDLMAGIPTSSCRGIRNSVVPVTDVEILPFGLPPRIIEANPMAFCSCRGRFLVLPVRECRKAKEGFAPPPMEATNNGRT